MGPLASFLSSPSESCGRRNVLRERKRERERERERKKGRKKERKREREREKGIKKERKKERKRDLSYFTSNGYFLAQLGQFFLFSTFCCL